MKLSDFFAALSTKYVADVELKAATPGGIHLDEAPVGTTEPYVVVSIVGDTPEYTFTHGFENVIIRFEIYHKSASTVGLSTAWKELTECFDLCGLAVTGYNTIWMRRINGDTTIDDGVRVALLDYELFVRKT